MRPLVILAILLLSQPALAWGPEGHSIVAEIAQRRLSAEARAGVEATIGAAVSMASVGSWADDERARDRSTSRWHFVNPPRGATTYDPTRDCLFIEGEGDCLIAALHREVNAVACASKTPERRQRALKFIVHLIGDLHQPLHAIGEDRGGNNLKTVVSVHKGANPRASYSSNLHKVWDETLPQTIAWSWGSYVERLEVEFLPSADVAALTAGSAADWLLESHKTGIAVFDAMSRGSILGDAYREKYTPIVDRQLAVGGLRLAKVLNEAFAAKACAS